MPNQPWVLPSAEEIAAWTPDFETTFSPPAASKQRVDGGGVGETLRSLLAGLG